VLVLIMVFNLLALPTQLTRMTNDAYFSISGVSRVLVEANQANRAESSAIIDSDRKADWYKQFDEAAQSVELRICGQPGCMQNSFTLPNTNLATSQVIFDAQNISLANAAAIDNINPLLARLTYSSEVVGARKSTPGLR
jgi:ABC-type enterochelin transport system substrate-binding protein